MCSFLLLQTPRKEEEEFSFLPPEKEPVFHKDFKERARKAVKAVAIEVTEEKEKVDPSAPGCCNCKGLHELFQRCMPNVCKRSEEPSSTKLTPQLKNASKRGLKMMKKLFFPAIPKLLRDLWVGAELAITLVAFSIGMASFSFGENSTFNLVYLVLTIISLILALIDGFIYFFQMGSCAEAVRSCRARMRERRHAELEESDSTETPARKRCWHLSPTWKERFNTWFELIRNILSELLLYPLLIFDLFDFLTGGSFRGISHSDRLDFGLFVVGSFYLILAVYIMRMFMVIGTIVSLRRIPINASGSQKESTALFVRFCIHVLGQIISHLIIIIAVATKIQHENPVIGADSVRASPFLWTVIALGWVIPLAGIVSFLLMNYYWVKQFSIGFFIDMMSLLQAPSFADVVFDGDGTSAVKDQAKGVVEKGELKDVKEQFQAYKSPATIVKFLYPLRVLPVMIPSLFYASFIVGFVSLLPLSTNPSSGNIEFILFESTGLKVMFFIAAVCLLFANIQMLVLVLLWFVSVGVIVVLVGAIVVIASPVLIPLCCCYICLKSFLDETNLFHETGIIVEPPKSKKRRRKRKKKRNRVKRMNGIHHKPLPKSVGVHKNTITVEFSKLQSDTLENNNTPEELCVTVIENINQNSEPLQDDTTTELKPVTQESEQVIVTVTLEDN